VALRAAGAGAVLAAVLVAGLATGLPWMLVGAGGGALYLLLVIRLGLLPREVFRMLRGMVVWRAFTEVV
jgi:hypothetical protein